MSGLTLSTTSVLLELEKPIALSVASNHLHWGVVCILLFCLLRLADFMSEIRPSLLLSIPFYTYSSISPSRIIHFSGAGHYW